MAIWIPDLSGRRGPKYLQIVEALADAVKSGALAPGARLPPHRELAHALGVSANTTSRAYSEGVQRALLRGEVGRGTFIRAPSDLMASQREIDLRRPSEGPIDFSRNLPNVGAAAAHLADALAEIGADDLQGLVDYQTSGDLTAHREAAMAWLGRFGLRAGEDTVVTTIGAQHAILVALAAILEPGDLLLTEALTYQPIMAVAQRLGVRVAPLAMDQDGPRPDALERACRDSAPKALYLTPTIQTPTAITLPPERRAQLARIIEAQELILIEDDVFGALPPEPVPPIAQQIPERAIYLTSASKALSPALRVGYARAPARIAPALRAAVALSCWMPPPLMSEIAARWIRSGSADALTAAQRSIAARRQTLAAEALAGFDVSAHPFGLHVWLTPPAPWTADALRAEAEARGVIVTGGGAFAVEPGARPNAVRLCLSHERDERRVKDGLGVLASLLSAPKSWAPLTL